MDFQHQSDGCTGELAEQQQQQQQQEALPQYSKNGVTSDSWQQQQQHQQQPNQVPQPLPSQQSQFPTPMQLLAQQQMGGMQQHAANMMIMRQQAMAMAMPHNQLNPGIFGAATPAHLQQQQLQMMMQMGSTMNGVEAGAGAASSSTPGEVGEDEDHGESPPETQNDKNNNISHLPILTLVLSDQEKKAHFPSPASKPNISQALPMSSLNKYRDTWTRVVRKAGQLQVQTISRPNDLEAQIKQCFRRILLGERLNTDMAERMEQRKQTQQTQQQQNAKGAQTQESDNQINNNTRDESSLPLIKRARYNYEQHQS